MDPLRRGIPYPLRPCTCWWVREGWRERRSWGPEFSQGEESQEALAGEAEALMGQTGSLGEKLEGEGECLVLGI